MEEERYDNVKQAVLSHIQSVFQELEKDMAMSHQEKYALLEDAFENANDADELRVAFEQWFADHTTDLDLEQDVNELWEQAVAQIED